MENKAYLCTIERNNKIATIMKLQEYLQLCTILACKGEPEKNYRAFANMFITPLVYCKDGFRISIQVNRLNYCSSENGYRTYGETFKTAEWGFPSEPIDGKKYNCEMYEDEGFKMEDTTRSIGNTDVELLQSLLDEHGGIDVIRTFKEGWCKVAKYFVGKNFNNHINVS